MTNPTEFDQLPRMGVPFTVTPKPDAGYVYAPYIPVTPTPTLMTKHCKVTNKEAVMASLSPLSFFASVSSEFKERDLIEPVKSKTKLPRKMKKAVTTMFYKCSKNSVDVCVNPIPRNKWQCRVKRRCKPFEIMTPKGEMLKFKIV